ncbi:hypothetical protein H0H93_005166 [Arthromyces matolae]|nr:hypothetical protein H0H93_005166 [Arthromyces matolae]
MSRGVTMSPRITVYKAIACRAVNAEQGSTDLSLLDFMTTAVDCSSPQVQARVARIQASVVTLMSVLSAIVTGFWSRLGDVHGRKPVFAVFLLGATFMELMYVLVMHADSLFGRHAEKFILAGPIVEGLVGAIPLTARDKAPGILFVGLAAGPWFSGLVLPNTDIVDVEDAFVLSISLLIGTLVYVLLLCPESREPTAPERGVSTTEGLSFASDPLTVIRGYLTRFISALMIPITMFAPRIVPGRAGRNWNITLVGMGLFLYLVSIGVYSAKYIYAQHVYSWTTAQLGYYMSLLWITRAFNLLFFLPVIIWYFKPQFTGTTPDSAHLAAEMRFDKILATASLALDGLSDALIAIAARSSQNTFIGLSCLSSLTSGGNPTLHSLGAVCLHACGYGAETGALFGGMAVLSAIAHIINPYIYALTYGATVATFPQAIFVLTAVLLFSAVFLLTGISSKAEDVIVHDAQDEE